MTALNQYLHLHELPIALRPHFALVVLISDWMTPHLGPPKKWTVESQSLLHKSARKYYPTTDGNLPPGDANGLGFSKNEPVKDPQRLEESWGIFSGDPSPLTPQVEKKLSASSFP